MADDGDGRVTGLTTRQRDGWRAGKPLEDPEKVKGWGRITARPSEYLVHMRGGRLLEGSSGQGASCWKWPADAVSIVPTTVQRLRFVADQITREKVGVQVTGIAVYRIAQPRLAFRMLNFSYPERASEKLEELLAEMFVGSARRLVANMALEECLTRRKDGLAAELMREIAPVVSGSGREDDETDRGWGVVLDTIEIQDVRVSSREVFAHLQAPFREEAARVAREAELHRQRITVHQENEANRELELERLQVRTELAEQREREEQRARLEQVAAGLRVQRASIEAEQAIEEARREAQSRRHAAALEAEEHQRVLAAKQSEVARERLALVEAELLLAELAARRAQVQQSAELSKLREMKAIENTVSPEAIQLALAAQLPQLASALQHGLGEVHITAVDGANPFGYVASAVEALLSMARAAGLTLPKED